MMQEESLLRHGAEREPFGNMMQEESLLRHDAGGTWFAAIGIKQNNFAGLSGMRCGYDLYRRL